jgi:hypothetical protein
MSLSFSNFDLIVNMLEYILNKLSISFLKLRIVIFLLNSSNIPFTPLISLFNNLILETASFILSSLQAALFLSQKLDFSSIFFNKSSNSC